MFWVDFIMRMVICGALGFVVPQIISLRRAVADLRRQVLYLYAMRVIDLGDEARAMGVPCPGCGGTAAHSEDCGVYTAKMMLDEAMERIRKEGQTP